MRARSLSPHLFLRLVLLLLLLLLLLKRGLKPTLPHAAAQFLKSKESYFSSSATTSGTSGGVKRK
jgi:hypothetical protein